LPAADYLFWIKLDFVLAVLLTVLVPLLLLFSSIKEPPLQYRLLAYWRISALLAITVYLLMAESSIGLLSGVVARILIPPVLWLGDGLMKSSSPLAAQGKSIYRLFYWWRGAVSIYCLLGVIFTLPLLQCGWTGMVTERCAAWYIPPQMFGSLLHEPTQWQRFGEYALVALVVYVVYLLAAISRLLYIRLA
jgi:hypothetical protein